MLLTTNQPSFTFSKMRKLTLIDVDQRINHHYLSRTLEPIDNHHSRSSTIMNHDSPSLTIINHLNHIDDCNHLVIIHDHLPNHD